MVKIAIFASGSGSNAENIIKVLSGQVETTCIYCNNTTAGVIERAKRLHIPIQLFNKITFYQSDSILDTLLASGTEYIVLAGFLWLIPDNILNAFRDRIINIHPALLPKYGGKGMFGMNVHAAVVANREKESGITIHLVNEKYDDGRHLFQAKCPVTESDTPNTVAEKVHQLEHEHFPRIILDYIQRN